MQVQLLPHPFSFFMIICLCLLALILAPIIAVVKMNRPQYGCRHQWTSKVLWETKSGITHRHECTKCGKTETGQTVHYRHVE